MKYLLPFFLLCYLHTLAQEEKSKQLNRMLDASSVWSLPAFDRKVDSVKRFLELNVRQMFPDQDVYTSIAKPLEKYQKGETNKILPCLKGPLSIRQYIVKSYDLRPDFDLANRYADSMRIISGSQEDYFSKVGDLYTADFSVYYKYIPVKLEKTDALYKKLDSLNETGLYFDQDSAKGVMKFIRKLSYRTKSGCNGFTDDLFDTSFNLFLKLPPELQVPNLEFILVQGSIETLKNKIPLKTPSKDILPICLITQDHNIYALKKVHLSSFDKSAYMMLTSNGMKYSDEVPMFRFDTRDAQQQRKIMADMCMLIKKVMTKEPYNASVEMELTNQLVFSRNKQKSPLLQGKYELSSYTFGLQASEFLDHITKQPFEGVQLLIYLHILTASHPDNPFSDLTAKEMSNYDKAIVNLKKYLQTELCKKYKCAGTNSPVKIK